MRFNLKNRKLLLAEIILLLASVLIFRSLWLLLDMFSVMNKPQALAVSLFIGIVLTIPALRYIIKND